ncbi:GTPase activator activity, partial [Bonamia ostreae]
MVYKFDWFSAIVPFGIAEIFDIFSLIMNFSIDYSLLVSTEENPLILSAFVQNKNDSVLWERWRKEENNSFTIIEPRIENQRLYFSKWSKPFLPRDPSHFTDLTKRVPWKNNNLEENWEWVEEWHPKVIPNLTDSDGWAYGRSFIGWSRKKPRKSFFDSTRSRFLVRKRVSDFRSDIVFY